MSNSLETLKASAVDKLLDLPEVKEIVTQIEKNCSKVDSQDCFTQANYEAYSLLKAETYRGDRMPEVALSEEGEKFFNEVRWNSDFEMAALEYLLPTLRASASEAAAKRAEVQAAQAIEEENNDVASFLTAGLCCAAVVVESIVIAGRFVLRRFTPGALFIINPEILDDVFTVPGTGPQREVA